MVGKWELSNKEKTYLREKISKHIRKITKEQKNMLDLTGKNIAPNQLYEIICSLDWEEKDYFQGYENDYWIIFEKNNCQNLIMYVSGNTFEMAIYLEKNKDNIKTKEDHRLTMIGGMNDE